MDSYDILTKETTLAALRRLDELLREKGVIGEFCIIDHATRLISFGMRNSTSDRQTMSMVSSSVDFDDARAEFLDRFNEAPSTELLMEEPDLLEAQVGDNGRADAFLASTAAYLAQEHGLPVPPWAEGNSRALKKPWFAAKFHNLRMILLQKSPAAFRLRNLFVSANALHRA